MIDPAVIELMRSATSMIDAELVVGIDNLICLGIEVSSMSLLMCMTRDGDERFVILVDGEPTFEVVKMLRIKTETTTIDERSCHGQTVVSATIETRWMRDVGQPAAMAASTASPTLSCCRHAQHDGDVCPLDAATSSLG